MSIVLIGYRCSGKTTVGLILASMMKFNFLDTDRLIEDKLKMNISEFVVTNGWKEFRRVERSVIRNLKAECGVVIATGGGAVTNHDNINYLKKIGALVWLRAEVDLLCARMRGQPNGANIRPPIKGRDPSKEIMALLACRTPLYESASDHIVDTDGISPEQVAEEIMRII